MNPDPVSDQGKAERSGVEARQDPEHLVVGQISRVHGNRGELYVWPLTDDPDEVFVEGAEVLLSDAEGKLGPRPHVLEIASRRPFKRGLLVKFAGHEDRTAAEPLARRYLLAPIEQLRAPEAGEVFYHQMLGLEVLTGEGESLGRVREVFEIGPGYLLEVAGDEGRTRLIPFVEHVVREVDVDGGRLVIDPPEGLLDL